MRNFGRYLAAASLLWALSGGPDGVLDAQTDTGVPAAQVPPRQTAVRMRYDALLAQQELVSKSPAATADDVRVVINHLWVFVRRYPTNGLADNALREAANLSAEAFDRFGEDRDRYRAIQFLQWLRDQYPHSDFVVDASTQIVPLVDVEQTETASLDRQAQLQALPQSATTDVIIRAVHREVLPDVVRITIELDQEVPFYQERLDGPSRLFFDLKGTRTVPSLADATFRYDSGVVRHIRLGRHLATPPASCSTSSMSCDTACSRSITRTASSSTRSQRPPCSRGARYRNAGNAQPAQPLRTPIASPSRRVEPPPLRGAEHGVHLRACRRYGGQVPRAASAAARQPRSWRDGRRPNLLRKRGGRQPCACRRYGGQVGPSHAGKADCSRDEFQRQVLRREAAGLGISRVVIDAGHGGHDPGASALVFRKRSSCWTWP